MAVIMNKSLPVIGRALPERGDCGYLGRRDEGGTPGGPLGQATASGCRVIQQPGMRLQRAGPRAGRRSP